jgi:hypothetical protein
MSVISFCVGFVQGVCGRDFVQADDRTQVYVSRETCISSRNCANRAPTDVQTSDTAALYGFLVGATLRTAVCGRRRVTAVNRVYWFLHVDATAATRAALNVCKAAATSGSATKSLSASNLRAGAAFDNSNSSANHAAALAIAVHGSTMPLVMASVANLAYTHTLFGSVHFDSEISSRVTDAAELQNCCVEVSIPETDYTAHAKGTLITIRVAVYPTSEARMSPHTLQSPTRTRQRLTNATQPLWSANVRFLFFHKQRQHVAKAEMTHGTGPDLPLLARRDISLTPALPLQWADITEDRNPIHVYVHHTGNNIRRIWYFCGLSLHCSTVITIQVQIETRSTSFRVQRGCDSSRIKCRVDITLCDR